MWMQMLVGKLSESFYENQLEVFTFEQGKCISLTEV